MNNIEELRNYCLSKHMATEDMPFGEGTVTFRIGEKIFALLSFYKPPFRLNLKCDPNRVEQLREENHFIIPGFHMNKKHWNSIIVEEIDNASLVRELIDHSYDLILNALPKKTKQPIIDAI